MTGLRHWFGNSGWALNAGVRWNVAKFSHDNNECRVHGARRLRSRRPGRPDVRADAPRRRRSAAASSGSAPVPPPPPPLRLRLRSRRLSRRRSLRRISRPSSVPTRSTSSPGSARLTNIAKAILDDVALRMKQEPTSTAHRHRLHRRQGEHRTESRISIAAAPKRSATTSSAATASTRRASPSKAATLASRSATTPPRKAVCATAAS